MDAPLYLLVLCTALWCPLYEHPASQYTMTRADCLFAARLVKAAYQPQQVYCLRRGGYEVLRSDGSVQWTHNEVR